MINHRYTILSKIGEGGSGEVFLVEDSLKHHWKQAMKILHSSAAAHAGEDIQFQNEVASLLHLQHPGLVRMLDFGLVRASSVPSLLQRRFFTTEYVEGGDILHTIGATSDGRGHLLKALFLQTLHVLDYIHRRGVIHFDVKPANLLLVSGIGNDLDVPILKLTDFGFSKRASEEIEQSLRGTLEYTAPELLRREPYDHRIDLYSLGATFYHLMEGRCPFEADEPVELIKRVLTEEAEFSARTDPTLTALHDVLRVLLHKKPSERFGSARETAIRLLQGDESGLRAFFGGVARPAFVGRSVERKRLCTVIDGLVRSTNDTKDQPKVIVISGREGMGKHALAEEVARYARSKGVPVFDAEGGQREIPFSYMKDMMGLLQAEARSRIANEERLSPGYPQLPSPDPDRDSGLPVAREWQQDREWLIERHTRFLLECSEVVPFVILASTNEIDAESFAVLQTVARDAKQGGLLLLLVEDSSHPTPLSQQVEVLPIAELTGEEVVALCTASFDPPSVGAEIGARFFQLYGGVPTLVVEAIHSLHEIIRPDSLDLIGEQPSLVDGWLERLPKDIDQFLVNRYEGLSRECQLLLAMMACCEAPVPIELMVSVLPFERRRLEEYLQRLSTEGYISLDTSARQVSFRQAKLKSAVYTFIASGKQELHATIAEALERMPATFALLQERARQYQAAGKLKKASLAAEVAAEEGMKLSAFQRSIELYHDAIRSASSGENLHRIRRLRGKLAGVLLQAGHYKEAIDLAKELIEKEDIEMEDRYALLTTLGISQSKLGEYAESRQYLTEAATMAPNEVDEMQLRQELVGVDIAVGRFVEAERQCRLQLESTSRRSYERLHAAISTDLGIALFFQNRFDESASCFNDALDFYKKVADHRHIADAMLNIGNSMSAKGDHGSAIVNWRNALEMSRQYGTLNQQAQILNSLGIAHYKLRQFREAKELYNESLQISERIDSKPGVAYALTNLGEVCHAEGEYENALETWSRGYDLYVTMDDARGLTETLLQLARLQTTLGDTLQGRESAERARRVITERGLDTFLGQFKYIEGVLWLQRKDTARARAELTDAEALLRKEEDDEGRWWATLRLAECMSQQGDEEEAIALIKNVLVDADGNPGIVAEARLVLGLLARDRPGLVDEKPLALFKRGLDAIEKEPLTELSWKLSLELAREFDARGQHDKADHYLQQASIILQFFVRNIHSASLREQFLKAEGRGSLLSLANDRLHFQGDWKT